MCFVWYRELGFGTCLTNAEHAEYQEFQKLPNVNHVCAELNAKGCTILVEASCTKAFTTIRFNPLSPKWVNTDPQLLPKLRTAVLNWH